MNDDGVENSQELSKAGGFTYCDNVRSPSDVSDIIEYINHEIEHVHNTPAQDHSMSLKFATIYNHDTRIEWNLFRKLLNQHERHDCHVMNEIDLSYFDLVSYQEHLLSGPVCTYKTSHNLSQALLSTRI